MAYEWKIDDLESLGRGMKQKSVSPSFSLAGHAWALELYPGGYRPDAAGHVALFLRYKGGKAVVRVT